MSLYRRLHDRFGAAGVVLGLIALTIALGGTALAASKLTAPEKKEVKKIAKAEAQKYANSNPGPEGKQGPAGKDGTAGKNGTNGTNGANGKSVEVGTEATGTGNCSGFGGATVQVAGEPATQKIACNGQTGYVEQLPSGKTEYGRFGNGFAVSIETQPVNISYQFPLASNPTVNWIKADGTTAQFGNIANCPGTADAPAANAGNLCVYTKVENGVAQQPVNNGLLAHKTKYGFLTYVGLEGPSGLIYGTWAVKAP